MLVTSLPITLVIQSKESLEPSSPPSDGRGSLYRFRGPGAGRHSGQFLSPILFDEIHFTQLKICGFDQRLKSGYLWQKLLLPVVVNFVLCPLTAVFDLVPLFGIGNFRATADAGKLNFAQPVASAVPTHDVGEGTGLDGRIVVHALKVGWRSQYSLPNINTPSNPSQVIVCSISDHRARWA